MPIEHINKTDTLNEGREKLNAAIDGANAADVTSKEADTKATQALANSECTQTQLDTIVIDGDSSVEAAQARVDEKGVPHPTLKARIDDGMNSVNQQLAQNTEHVKDVEINIAYPPIPFNAVTPENPDTPTLQGLVDYCIDNGYKLAFPTGKDRYQFDEWHISGYLEIDFKRNILAYDGEKDFITVTTNHRNAPKLKNFTLLGSDLKEGNGIHVVRSNNSWGSSIHLENFVIYYFNVGMKMIGSR